MAFSARGLSPVGPLNNNENPTVWVYKTLDAPGTVDGAAYWPTGYGLKVGDILFVVQVDSMDAPTALSAAQVTVVSAITAGLPDLGTGTVIVVTNSD